MTPSEATRAAFPLNTGNSNKAGAFKPWPGLSIREYFAAQIATATPVPDAALTPDATSRAMDRWAERVVRATDALLQRLGA